VRSVETREFLEFIFEDLRDGYLCIVTIDRAAPLAKQVTQKFYEWPESVDDALRFVESEKSHKDVYFSPFLYTRKRRKKEYVSETSVAWADGDDCPLESLKLGPSAVVRSSSVNGKSKYHFYWKLGTVESAQIGEELSKRIAYYHESEGMDKSGWDLTQLLRLPDTINHKYGEPVRVSQAVVDEGLTYRYEDFSVYPHVDESINELVAFEDVDIPDVSGQEIMVENKTSLNPRAFELFNVVPDNDRDWSKRLWELELTLLEGGLTPEEAFVVARDSACNKYERDGRPERNLWKEVQKAKIFVDQREESAPEFETKVRVKLPELLTPEQREAVKADETFVERYTSWAKNLGDAASQYHPAGAFVILSSLLCSNVRLPTSFGMVYPNLWFMILADTTLTRKSTAMDNATDLLLDIDSDILLATDGSIEGMLTAMALRSGKPSLFLRDEITGLIDAMNKKEYMAGMMETLTKMYDGKHMKRVLRKETIDVKEPRLVMFSGGIRNKMLDILDYKHVGSGFLPRFIFITAESDITRIKPVGPPTNLDLKTRDKLVEEGQELYKHYATPVVKPGTGTVTFPKQWNATLSDDAWTLYNQFEFKLLEFALDSYDPTLFTPMMDRLAKSGLKAAVLLAASRKHDTHIEVTELDILHAFYYVEQWSGHTATIIGSIGSSQDEKKLDKILNEIRRAPGVHRSKLMQKYRLTARQANDIFTTLEQRNAIRRESRGAKQERLYPTGV
jgi:ribosomal protein S25